MPAGSRRGKRRGNSNHGSSRGSKRRDSSKRGRSKDVRHTHTGARYSRAHVHKPQSGSGRRAPSRRAARLQVLGGWSCRWHELL